MVVFVRDDTSRLEKRGKGLQSRDSAFGDFMRLRSLRVVSNGWFEQPFLESLGRRTCQI